jgi:DNA segregation ATPase FtsK/SpoIIIE-like protein
VKGEVVRFQAAYVSEAEVEAIVGRLRQGERKSRQPEWLVREQANPRATHGASELPEEMAKTGTGDLPQVFGGRRRQSINLVAEQLRLIK